MQTVTRSELAVLDIIRSRGMVTRAQVSATVGLGTAMTARILQHLREQGLVRIAGRAAPGGPGRPTQIIELHPNAARVVGVDIGSDRVRFVVSDAHGAVVATSELDVSLLDGLDQDDVVRSLAREIEGFVRQADMSLAHMRVLGVAVTGIIDSERGVCLFRSITPGWERFHLADRLGQTLQIPVVLGETSRARAVAELRIGSARGATDFLYVDAGMAIGAGIVIGGKPYRGDEGLAGELGHLTVDPNGPMCRCGNRGCVQATASIRAVVDRAVGLLRGGVYSSLADKADALTLDDLVLAAEHGDKLALGVLTEAGEWLGEAISMALNLLGIELVVLGGPLVRGGDVVLDAVSRIVRLRVLPIVGRNRMLVRSTLGGDSGARGIALQAVDWLFDAPADRLFKRAAPGNGYATSAWFPRATIGARTAGSVAVGAEVR